MPPGTAPSFSQSIPLFSIFAFATCGGFSGSLRLSIECAPPNRSAPITVAFGYPFRLHQVYFEAPSCGGGPPERVFLVGDHSSAAQFFVTVGVGSFLYAPAALGGYLFAPQAYRAGGAGPESGLEGLRWNLGGLGVSRGVPVRPPGLPGGGRGPRVELGVTAALAFLWLVASCAWAAALAEVKAATAPAAVLAQVGGCQRPGARCQALGAPRTSGLNTSVPQNPKKPPKIPKNPQKSTKSPKIPQIPQVFGFLNLVLWTGNPKNPPQKNAPKPPNIPQNHPQIQKKPQKAPKISQKIPKNSQKSPKIPPKIPQIPQVFGFLNLVLWTGNPKNLPKKMPQNPQIFPKTTPKSQKKPQKAPKISQKIPKNSQKSPKIPPKIPQIPQVFGFLNLVLWTGNLWFVFKETG
ncbi:uncharacterized protein LOC144247931, partial [Lonchura striata]